MTIRLAGRSLLLRGIALLALPLSLAGPVLALDKVRVGVFLVVSALPYYVAVERGFFREAGIETEAVRLMGGPPIVAAMITGDLDATSNRVV
jgi:NitT/TauT family transport system substrate-binding protein